VLLLRVTGVLLAAATSRITPARHALGLLRHAEGPVLTAEQFALVK
jgi:hypothetical protein